MGLIVNEPGVLPVAFAAARVKDHRHTGVVAQGPAFARGPGSVRRVVVLVHLAQEVRAHFAAGGDLLLQFRQSDAHPAVAADADLPDRRFRVPEDVVDGVRVVAPVEFAESPGILPVSVAADGDDGQPVRDVRGGAESVGHGGRRAHEEDEERVRVVLAGFVDDALRAFAERAVLGPDLPVQHRHVGAHQVEQLPGGVIAALHGALAHEMLGDDGLDLQLGGEQRVGNGEGIVRLTGRVGGHDHADALGFGHGELVFHGAPP